MIRYQNPSKALGLRLSENVNQSSNKRFSVLVVLEDFTAFDPPGHNMLKDTGSVKSWLTRHYRRSISFSLRGLNGRHGSYHGGQVSTFDNLLLSYLSSSYDHITPRHKRKTVRRKV